MRNCVKDRQGLWRQMNDMATTMLGAVRRQGPDSGWKIDLIPDESCHFPTALTGEDQELHHRPIRKAHGLRCFDDGNQLLFEENTIAGLLGRRLRQSGTRGFLYQRSPDAPVEQGS